MYKKVLKTRALLALCVARTAENGEAGIFWEARIGEREFAENEDGTAVRCDAACMSAGRAEAFDADAWFLNAVLGISHENRMRRRVQDCKEAEYMRGQAICGDAKLRGGGSVLG